MSQDSMVERVAKAIGDAIDAAETPVGFSEKVARAAIAAMRVPMGLSCVHGVRFSYDPVNVCVCHTSWKAMIDAALADGGQGGD